MDQKLLAMKTMLLESSGLPEIDVDVALGDLDIDSLARIEWLSSLEDLVDLPPDDFMDLVEDIGPNIDAMSVRQIFEAGQAAEALAAR